MNPPGSFQSDDEWSRAILGASEVVQHELAVVMVRFREATDLEDHHHATDIVMETDGGDVAIRLRRPTTEFRDFTIRKSRPTRSKTELAKIIEGWGRYFFYGWVSDNGQITSWVIVDLNKFRAYQLWVFGRERKNTDGTTFLAIDLSALTPAIVKQYPPILGAQFRRRPQFRETRD